MSYDVSRHCQHVERLGYPANISAIAPRKVRLIIAGPHPTSLRGLCLRAANPLTLARGATVSVRGAQPFPKKAITCRRILTFASLILAGICLLYLICLGLPQFILGSRDEEAFRKPSMSILGWIIPYHLHLPASHPIIGLC